MNEELQVTFVNVQTGERVTLTVSGRVEIVGWSRIPSPVMQALIRYQENIEDLNRRVADIERQGVPDKPRDGREYWFNQETREWVPYRPRM
jgi:hypothetical protein